MTKAKDHRLERTIFFSDAVIAIAMTLLVIEIRAPHIPHGNIEAGHAALRALIPNFFGFVLSFLVIGRFWSSHSAALAGMHGYDPRLFRVNMYFLMMIVILPFSTSFLSENIGEVVPSVFYGATLTAAALANLAVVWIASDNKNGHSDFAAGDASLIRRRSMVVVAAAAISTVLALFVPVFSQIPLILLLFGDRFLRRFVKLENI